MLCQSAAIATFWYAEIAPPGLNQEKTPRDTFYEKLSIKRTYILPVINVISVFVATPGENLFDKRNIVLVTMIQD